MSEENVGITDYPETDIATHRSLARSDLIFSGLIGVLAVYDIITGAWGWAIFEVGFAAVLLWSRKSLLSEAEDWEEALEKGDDARDSDV